MPVSASINSNLGNYLSADTGLFSSSACSGRASTFRSLFFLLGCRHMQIGQAIGFTRIAITTDICMSAKISSPHSPYHTSSFFSFLFHFLSFLLSQPAHTTRSANSVQLSMLTALSFSISFCSFFSFYLSLL